jgi:hypothetical protein
MLNGDNWHCSPDQLVSVIRPRLHQESELHVTLLNWLIPGLTRMEKMGLCWTLVRSLRQTAKPVGDLKNWVDGMSMNGKHIKLELDAMDVTQLCHVYRNLDQRRKQIDEQMMTQVEEAGAREQLWSELETTLAQLDDITDRLTRLPAARLSELRAKATVVAALMNGTGPDVAEGQRTGLALSLANDMLGFRLRKPRS